jgi:hypothetical protein
MQITYCRGERIAVLTDGELELLGERFVARGAEVGNGRSFFDFVCECVEEQLSELRSVDPVCVLTREVMRHAHAYGN